MVDAAADNLTALPISMAQVMTAFACQLGMPRGVLQGELISAAQVELSFKPQIRLDDSLQWTQNY